MSVVGLGPIKAPELGSPESLGSLGSLGSVGSIGSPDPTPKVAKADQDFGNVFASALNEARGAERTATTSAEQFAKGDPGMGIHEVMIASEKANISIRYATTLKNKALEAYRELMNTQV